MPGILFRDTKVSWKVCTRRVRLESFNNKEVIKHTLIPVHSKKHVQRKRAAELKCFYVVSFLSPLAGFFNGSLIPIKYNKVHVKCNGIIIGINYHVCFQIACICMLFLLLPLACEGGYIKKRPAGCYSSRRQCEAKVSTIKK